MSVILCSGLGLVRYCCVVCSRLLVVVFIVLFMLMVLGVLFVFGIV